jgi:predicted metal-dependent HD superfamily phosphohydrolase
MSEELGTNPKWRWDELVAYTKRTFDLEFDVDFTNLFYELIVVPAYTNGRHYHTLRHVEYLLKHVEDFKGVSHPDRNLIKWSIWFHDIIYNSLRKDNEERSANVMADFMRAIGMPNEHIETMRWLILVTKHIGSPQTYLEDIICDLDLREFVNERHSKNSEEVREEFFHLSDDEFNEGRIQFIDWMLSKEYIYHTDLYRESLEALARQNLLREKESIIKNKNG